MTVTVLYNITKSLPAGEEQDLLSTNESFADSSAIAAALKKSGIDADLLEVTLKNFPTLPNIKTDLFFNQCYGVGSKPYTDYKIPQLLDKHRCLYTGAGPAALALSTDKAKTKRILQKVGVPTPKFWVIKTAKEKIKFDRPYILKPLHEDSSSGLSQKSVVTNQADFHRQAEYLLTTYRQPVLVEEYIEGQELNVTLVGNRESLQAFPITELEFSQKFRARFRWAINDFTAKWYKRSVQYREINRVLPKNLSGKVKSDTERLSKLAFTAICCRDYARMDIRLTANGTPYFLEVNPNPGIGKNDGATIGGLPFAKVSYEAFIKMIAMAALGRRALRGKSAGV